MNTIDYLLGAFLKERREHRDIGTRGLCRMVETEYEKGIAVAKVSPSYYSQIESGKGIRPEKITIEMLWSIGLVLKVDPLELFVRKYPDLPQKYLLKSERDKLFI